MTKTSSSVSIASLVAIACSALLAISAPASAQTYPDKPVTLVVPTGTGGTSDIIGRLVAPKLAAALGQPFVIANKPGANGNIGAAFVAKAPADGYTLLLGASLLSSASSLYRDLGFDPLKAFAPISLIAETPYFLITNAEVPAATAGELAALSKRKPGGLSYASVGVGSGPHLAGEAFAARTGAKLTHIPFTGAGQAVTELLSGRVDLIFVGLPPVQAHIKSGRLKVLGVAEPARSDFLPQAPTISETGAPGFVANSWFGLFAPAGTPESVVRKLSEATASILLDHEVRAQLRTMGAVPKPTTPQQFQAYYERDVGLIVQVIKASGITMQ
jgi:tripartite-type tricarboxylate transporter receptor subunit TctC